MAKFFGLDEYEWKAKAIENENEKKLTNFVNNQKKDSKASAKSTRDQAIKKAKADCELVEKAVNSQYWDTPKEERDKMLKEAQQKRDETIRQANETYNTSIKEIDSKPRESYIEDYKKSLKPLENHDVYADKTSDTTKTDGKTDDKTNDKTSDTTKAGNKASDKPDGNTGDKTDDKESDKPDDNTDDKASDKAEGNTGLSFTMKGGLRDRDPSRFATHADRQAEMHDIQAGEEGKSEQRWAQTANRDPRVEADKDAVAQAASKNEQKIHNMGNASAGAAALEREEGTPDIEAAKQRSDAAQEKAQAAQREKWGARQTAEGERAGADAARYNAWDLSNYNWKSDKLSRGENPEGEPEQEEVVEEKPEEPEQEEVVEEKPEEPKPEEKPEEPEPEEDKYGVANRQNVINYTNGNTVRRTYDPNNQKRCKAFYLKGGQVKRWPQGDVDANGNNDNGKDPKNDLPDWNMQMEEQLKSAVSGGSSFNRKEGESMNQYNTRMSKERGGNRYDNQKNFATRQGDLG